MLLAKNRWLPQVETKSRSPIHKDPPKFDELSTKTEVLYTGIKVIDLIEPYAKGGKVGLFGGAGVANCHYSRVNE